MDCGYCTCLPVFTDLNPLNIVLLNETNTKPRFMNVLYEVIIVVIYYLIIDKAAIHEHADNNSKYNRKDT